MNYSKDSKMYNFEFKEKFLKYKGYSEETKRVIRVLFGKISKVEREKEQDIYEFDRQCFELLLEELKAPTIRSLQNYISSIEQYINFAIHNGKVNPDKGNIASCYEKKR